MYRKCDKIDSSRQHGGFYRSDNNNKKLFRCNVCLKVYSKVTLYEAHLQIHNNKKLGSDRMCYKCGAVFTSLKELKVHVRGHNRRLRRYRCEICGSLFKSLAGRRKHKTVHLLTPEWSCKLCPYRFKQHSAYISHLKVHKIKEEPLDVELERHVWMCESCNLLFDNETLVLEHKLEHEIQDQQGVVVNIKTEPGVITDDNEEVLMVMVDDECDGVTESYIYSTGDHYECHICDEIFTDFDLISEHLSKHSNKDEYYECVDVEQQYQCRICKISFSCKSSLRRHHATHSPSVKYPCEECGTIFRGRSGLYLHRKRVHQGKRDYSCDYCNKKFSLKGQKENHERVHTGEKPYKCEICESTFRALSGLYAHRRTHTDERPYQCQVCGKRVRLPYNLRLHMRTHTGEKPYVCDICGRGFAQPGDCKKHKNTHRKRILQDEISVVSSK